MLRTPKHIYLQVQSGAIEEITLDISESEWLHSFFSVKSNTIYNLKGWYNPKTQTFEIWEEVPEDQLCGKVIDEDYDLEKYKILVRGHHIKESKDDENR